MLSLALGVSFLQSDVVWMKLNFPIALNAWGICKRNLRWVIVTVWLDWLIDWLMGVLTFRHLFPLFSAARMYFHPRGSGRRADWQCLLGAVLSGARNPAGRSDANQGRETRQPGLIHHLLQRDRGRQICARRFSTNFYFHHEIWKQNMGHRRF